MSDKDYYGILKIDKNADSKTIKNAYRELAFQYHPDRNKQHSESIEKMKTVNEAYAVLSNPEKRAEYDNMRQQFGSSAYTQFRKSHSDQDIFSNSDIFGIFEELSRSFGFRGSEEIFKDFYGQNYRQFDFKKSGFSARGFVFGKAFGKGAKSPLNPLPDGRRVNRLGHYLIKKIVGLQLPEAGNDMHDVIHLTPLHAEKGGPYAYYLKKRKKKLVVNIPPGTGDNQRIRLAGMGQKGKGGAKSGDLYLKVLIDKPFIQKAKDFIERFRP